MPYQDYALNQLIINKLSQEQYNALATAGEISANQLYFIEAAGNIDAASGTIENVADPINNTDAANKQYVDSFTTNSLSSYTELTASNDISALLNANITYVSSQVSGIPANITYVSSSLSGYSPKSDVIYVSGQVSGIPSTITSLSSTVSSTYLLKTDIPTAEDLGLSNYAAVSTVTDLSNSLSGYSSKSDVTYVSSQVSGLLPSINDLTSNVENINNNLSSFVTYSTSSTLEFTPIQGIQYGTLSANADGISSYFSGGGNLDSIYKSFSLIGTDSPKLKFSSLYEERDFGEILVSDLNETIYENGSITYNSNQLVFPEESGTLVVNSQLSSYTLSSEVSSTINKVSNIASSLSALSDISQIPTEYTIDTVVQKLNEVIIRINTLTTSLK